MSFDAWIRGLVRNGQGFIAHNGALTATNPNLIVPIISIFNPSNSGKTVYLYSMQMADNSSQQLYTYLTTSDPSGGSTFTQTITPVHLPGINNPASVVSVCGAPNNVSTSMTVVGTLMTSTMVGNFITTELLTNGTEIILPPGFGVYNRITVSSAGGFFEGDYKWVEI